MTDGVEVLVCNGCQAKLRLKAPVIKPRLKCPKCGTIAVVKTAAAPTASVAITDADRQLASTNGHGEQLPHQADLETPADVMRTLLAGFQGTAQRRGPSLGYRLTLIATAIATVALILLYCSLITAVGYGVYWYATIILPTAFSLPGRIGAMMLVVHASVVISGFMMVLSMVLPAFRVSSSQPHGELVSGRDGVLLQSFVAKVSEVLGAPSPQKFA